MTAPANRLLFWTAWLAIPLAIIAAAAPSLALLCIALAMLAALIPVVDLIAGLRRAPAISVELPEVARFSRMREGVYSATLAVEESVRPGLALRVGLLLPPEIAPDDAIQSIHLPGEPGRYPLTWRCTPRDRGRFAVSGARLERPSPLGLWAIRCSLPARGEIRVYPNLIEERNRLASVFLNRQGAGIHAQRQVGKGREFEQLRDYLPGDSFEDIHWKATARRGYPVTKMFQIERTQEIYVVVDASRLSARALPGAAAEPQLEHLLRAALLLGLAAEKQGDFFGLATFSDRVHTFIRAGKGHAHFAQCREALCALQPQLVNPDFEEVCAFLRMRLRRRALVVLLTNLDDPVLAETLTRNLELLSNRHLVLVNMITAPSVRPIFSAEAHGDDDIYAHLGGHLQWQSLRETQRALHRHGVDMHLTAHERLCGDLVAQYVNVKQRQLL